jgi:hypothetical protein
MGCIQEISYFPNIYILVILTCFLVWTKIQTKFLLQRWLINLIVLILIGSSFIFQSTCPTPCDFPCLLDVPVSLGLVLFAGFYLLMETARYIKNAS